jgi:hypothetical protein
MSTTSKVGYGMLAAAVALGLLGVFGLVEPLLAVVVAVVALVLLLPGTSPRLDVILLRLLGAALLAILSLAGVNFLANLIGLGHLWIPLGLVLAVAVFSAVAFFYLRHNGWNRLCSAIGAAVLAIGIVVVAPYAIGKWKEDTDPVPKSERVASQLDVAIVSDGRRHRPPPQLPPNPTLEEFDVHYSVGYAAGEQVRWTLLDEPDSEKALRTLAEGDGAPVVPGAPAPRQGADTALLLLVDGTEPVVEDPAALKSLDGFDPREVRRWRRVAAGAGAPAVPAFALLQTTDRRRLQRWRPFGRRESVVSAQALASQTATDAAVRLAVAAPTSQADFALAMAYRPILLFDRKETVPWPLSVDALFRGEKITLCHDEGVKSSCDPEPLRHAYELESPGTHLRLDIDSKSLKGLAERELAAQRGEPAAPELPVGAGPPPAGTPPPSVAPPEAGAPPGAGSTIYVHPASSTRDERELLYLDYWWYLPQNPVGLGGGALCGAGFVIPGVTCQSHESDWEGLTVVVDRTGERPRIEAVQYAQHDSVVRYEWEQLRKEWDGDPRVQALVEGIDDAGERPLVFVAAGTHAGYPTPCARGCQQVANSGLDEDQHRGNLGWVGNDTSACGSSSCLQMLPTRAGGRKPALWNAFEGPWGERHCWFTYYCDSGTPPSAPGQQKRYRHPARYSGYVDGAGRFRREQFED